MMTALKILIMKEEESIIHRWKMADDHYDDSFLIRCCWGKQCINVWTSCCWRHFDTDSFVYVCMRYLA